MKNSLKNYPSQLSETFKKEAVYSRFKDNIWGVALADKQLIRQFNKGFRFYYAILIFLVNMLGLFL